MGQKIILDVDDIAVSYTHLDVYKRQVIACQKKRRKSGAKSKRRAIR